MRASAADVKGVADRLHSAIVELVKTVTHTDAESGLSAPRLAVLSVLTSGGARTVGELAAAERVRSPSMTALVNGMERDGLVRRRPDPVDRRAVRVEASARGRRVLNRALERRLALLTSVLAAADSDELAAVQRTLDLIERTMPPADEG
jgi:DNA-binding MarR family transcriptional regulator